MQKTFKTHSSSGGARDFLEVKGVVWHKKGLESLL